MSDEVVRLRGVGVRRGGSVLLRDVDWTVHDDERWVIIGPNGAGKTTLLQVIACQLFPSEGSAEILGDRLGETDVFELRPRIGLASASLADRVPPAEKVIDLVLTGSYAIVGPLEGGLRVLRRHPRGRAARRARLRAPDPAPVRHPVRGGAQAGADRAGA